MSLMTTVYLAFLRKGPKWTAEDSPDLDRLQNEHLDYLFSLKRSGKLIINGPLTDGGDLRGMSVYRVETQAEARALAEADPAVRAGRLMIETHPWMIEKATLPQTS